MASRKSKGWLSPAIMIDDLEKLRSEAIEQLRAIEQQEKIIRKRLVNIEKYIKFLRPTPNAFDVLPGHLLAAIGNKLAEKEFVNLRATSRSMHNSLHISPIKQKEIDKAASEHMTANTERKLGLPLGDIVKETTKRNLVEQNRRRLNATHRADLKREESAARMGIQLLLQPKIGAQRAARVISPASPGVEFLSSSPKKSSR